MAEDKAEAGSNNGREVMLFLALLLLLSIFLIRFEEILASRGASLGALWASIAAFFILTFWPMVKALMIVLCVALVVGIVYAYAKLRDINIEERQIYGATNVAKLGGKGEELKNERWERIIGLMNSINPSDWRMAIIEADVMLEELLQAAGYHGVGVGEMLKAVEKSDMLTLEAAWEAHKIRNRIAHQAGNFELNEREAAHAIALYESVFKEFGMI